MDPKIKELISIGASIGANCLPCLEWHYNKCIELGIDKKDIKIAIEIGKKVKERPNKDIAEIADDLLNINTNLAPCCCEGKSCC